MASAEPRLGNPDQYGNLISVMTLKFIILNMHMEDEIFLNIVLNSECSLFGIILDTYENKFNVHDFICRNSQFKIVREDITVDGVIMDVIKKKGFLQSSYRYIRRDCKI